MSRHSRHHNRRRRAQRAFGHDEWETALQMEGAHPFHDGRPTADEREDERYPTGSVLQYPGGRRVGRVSSPGSTAAVPSQDLFARLTLIQQADDILAPLRCERGCTNGVLAPEIVEGLMLLRCPTCRDAPIVDYQFARIAERLARTVTQYRSLRDAATSPPADAPADSPYRDAP